MKHIYLFLITLFIGSFGFGQTLSPGDLAIIGLSVDDEEALIVALEDIPSGESVFFTDEEWGGSSFNSGEGFYEWITPAITAGTVFTIDTSGTSTGGTVTQKAGSFALGNSGDGLFLYQTSTNTYNSGIYTILGFAGEDSGDAGTLTGTGLTIGTNAIYYGGDNGIYTGTRAGQDKTTYLSLIYDSANWASSGSSQTFVTTDFTFAATCSAPTSEATAFSASSITTDAATLSWTRGTDGDNVIVIMKEGSAVDFSPSSGTAYSASANFSSGTELGTGNYVVYNGSGTSQAITGLSSSTTYYVAIYEFNDTDTCYMNTALTGDFTTLTSTTVEFTSATATITEGVSTYDLEFSIANEDAAATSFDVVLTSGDNADINGYTTQTVTFAGGSNTNQTVTITVTDDAIEELAETLTFEIQNVTGGNIASTGTISSFDLIISASDSTTPLAGDIVISEIMYNSSGFDDEWIEIYNASGNDINLDSDWELNYGSNSFDFSGTIITAGSYLTIAFGSNGDDTYNNDNPFTPDVTTFATPATIASVENTNNVGNGSATISLVYDPSGTNVTIDTVTYDDASPWPTTPDGNGPSLELPVLSSDNSLGSNWEASDIDGGTPGTGYSFTYTYNGTWSPSDPTGVATALDNIIIASGDVTMTTDITANTVTVNPGASLTINTGITLTATTVTLESASDSFSSLISDGTISGTVSYERFVNTLSTGTGGNDLISLPLMPTGLTFDTFITNGENATEIADNGTYYAFAPYNNTNVAYENFLMGATDVLLKAKGYRAATDSGDLLTFSGTPDNSTVSITIDKPALGSEWNLIGNPYTSYVDADLFLSVANSALLDESAEAIYAYNSGIYTGAAPTTSNFTIINKATITASTGENFNIAPGQGFFVASNATGGSIEFTPAMRTLSGDDDYITGRTSNNSEFFKLNLIGSQTYSTSIFFNTNASLGLDPGYDAAVYGEDSENYPIFSHLVEENTGRAMALQAIDPTDLTSVSIPLGVNANQGEAITFSIDASNLSSTTLVYLEDTVANTYTLLNSGDYTLTPSTNLSGTGRFYLQISNVTLSTIDNNFDQLNIYSNQNEKTIVIAGQLVDATKATIYDIQGRVVNTSVLQNNSSSQSIDVRHLNTGVYIIQLANGSQNKTQKVIIR